MECDKKRWFNTFVVRGLQFTCTEGIIVKLIIALGFIVLSVLLKVKVCLFSRQARLAGLYRGARLRR